MRCTQSTEHTAQQGEDEGQRRERDSWRGRSKFVFISDPQTAQMAVEVGSKSATLVDPWDAVRIPLLRPCCDAASVEVEQ